MIHAWGKLEVVRRLLRPVLMLAAVTWSGGVHGQSAPTDVPWDLNELSRPPAWNALDRPKSDTGRPIFFTGPMYRGKPSRVFAWLKVPEVRPGEKVPAMVLIHGGGGTAFEEWVDLWVKRGYAAIAMDTCGQVPVGKYGQWVEDAEGGPHGWGGFDQINEPKTDQWAYQAVSKIILAHSLIRSLKEVDPERTGVTGISWGGYLTCVAAGVDHRFKLAIPVYGCGFYDRTVFSQPLSRMTRDGASRWLKWWDASVYLSGASCPMLWVTGSNDFAYPMPALQASYRLPRTPRTLCVRLRMPHGHGGAGENPEEIRVFADSILKAGTPLPRIVKQGRAGNEVRATFDSKLPVRKAELNFTCDRGPWEKRNWESKPARVSGDHVGAELPEGALVYYLNLYDERGCVVSTEHELVDSD